MDTANAKYLAIKNENNKLRCNAFVEIHFAPPGPIKESEMHKLYYVQVEGETVFLELVDIMRIPFQAINGTMTLPATGKEWHEWKLDWMGRFTNTLPDTPMAVYYYKRKND